MAEIKVDRKEDKVTISLVLAGRTVGSTTVPSELYDVNPLRVVELALSLISAEIDVLAKMAEAQVEAKKKRK